VIYQDQDYTTVTSLNPYSTTDALKKSLTHCLFTFIDSLNCIITPARGIAIRRVCWFVRSLTSRKPLHWLAGGRWAVGRRAIGLRTGAQHRSDVVGTWRRVAPVERSF